jgi:2-polyprenyl-3-methyl-5-hydroxy-6-metoxy-1,4-benzoquinol methylase
LGVVIGHRRQKWRSKSGPFDIAGGKIVTPTLAEASLEAVQSANAVFRSVHYARHNARRQEHLSSLGLQLPGRTVLEAGAGVGDRTTFFLDRGCTVVSVEPVAANCELFKLAMIARYQSGYEPASRSTLIHSDIESLDRTVNELFDIVYCYALLYHVQNSELALETMARRCRHLFLLETCVSFGNEEAINPTTEPTSPSQAFHGVGRRARGFSTA